MGVASVADTPTDLVVVVVYQSVGKVDNRYRLADHLPLVLQVFYLFRKVIGLHALHQVATIGADPSARNSCISMSPSSFPEGWCRSAP